jgi:hypothetical protein
MIHIPSAAAVCGAKAQFRQHVMTPSPGSHFEWHDLDSWFATKFPAFDAVIFLQPENAFILRLRLT